MEEATDALEPTPNPAAGRAEAAQERRESTGRPLDIRLWHFGSGAHGQTALLVHGCATWHEVRSPVEKRGEAVAECRSATNRRGGKKSIVAHPLTLTASLGPRDNRTYTLTIFRDFKISKIHGGEVATKVGYFGVKSAKVLREQMSTYGFNLLKSVVWLPVC